MGSSDAEDWRLSGQEKYLTGAEFVFRAYEPPWPGWDHDRCEFCWSKFSAGMSPMPPLPTESKTP